MESGRLNEVIEIWQPITTKDAYGAETKTLTLFKKTRANVKFVKGNKETVNDGVLFGYTYNFMIRGYHDVKEYMEIRWKGDRYYILSIDTTSKQEIIIITEKINE